MSLATPIRWPLRESRIWAVTPDPAAPLAAVRVRVYGPDQFTALGDAITATAAADGSYAAVIPPLSVAPGVAWLREELEAPGGSVLVAWWQLALEEPATVVPTART